MNDYLQSKKHLYLLNADKSYETKDQTELSSATRSVVVAVVAKTGKFCGNKKN